MFKNSKAKTVKEYIDSIEEPRKSQIIELHEFIQKCAPDLKVWLYGQIIGYGTYHYKTKSGQEGDWMILGLSNRKNYISVYACAADGHEYVAEKNKDILGKASIGKSCIRYKKMEDIDWKGLEKTLKEAVKWQKEGKIPQ